MRARGLAGAAVLALLLTGTVACTSAPVAAGGGKRTVAATPTPTVSDHPTSTARPHGRAALLAAMQAAIAAHRSAHLRMSMTGTSPISATGDVRYAGAGSAMRLTMAIPSLGTKAAEVRLLDGVMYVAAPPMTPTGKFVKIDTTDPNSPYAGSFGQLPSQLDPNTNLKVFRRGLRHVRYVGPETVDGQRLRHYVFRVDLTRALARAANGGQTAAPGKPKVVSYQVWLDRDSLMRRLRLHASGTTMTMQMSRWGEPVTVTAPPAADLIIPPGS